LSVKQKQQKSILGHGTAVWIVARAVLSFWLGGDVFLCRIFVFSSPNQLWILFLLLQDWIF